MKIKKVLNSSVVIAVDDQDREIICLGKGIGYNKKIGETVSEDVVNQVFKPIENNQLIEYLNMLESIPPIYLELAQKVINEAEYLLHCKFNVNAYFTLTDHLNFAVERFKKGINITNRVYWEIKNYYPKEFKIGAYALDLFNNTLNIQLPDEEAANIAFHIINAQSEGDISSDGMMYAKVIGEIINIVKYSLGTDIEDRGIHYQRFITHLKFFVERYFKHKMLLNENEQMFTQILHIYPDDMELVYKINGFLDKVYGEKITIEELSYLAVHVNRLRNYKE